MRARGMGAVVCDPFWTQQNGACSDQFGNFVDATGTSVSEVGRPSTLPAPVRTAVPRSAPAAEPSFFSGIVDWLGQDYNAVYAAGGLAVALVVFKSLMGGRR